MEQKEFQEKVVKVDTLPFGIDRIAVIANTIQNESNPYSITIGIVKEGCKGKLLTVDDIEGIYCNFVFPNVTSLDNVIQLFQNYSDNIKKGVYA